MRAIPALLTFVSIAGICGAAWHFSGKAGATTPKPDQRLDALEQSLDELKKKANEASPTVVYQALAPQNVEPAPSPAPSVAFDEDDRRARDAQLEVRVPEILKSRFQSEVADRAWASNAESRVSAGLRKLDTSDRGGSFRDVVCKTSMCRLMGSFKNQAEYNRMMGDMLTPRDQDSAAIIGPHGAVQRGTYEQAADGTVTVEIYVFREGQDFDARQALE